MTHLQEMLANCQSFQDLLSIQQKLFDLSNENLSDILNIIQNYLSIRKTKSTLRSIFSLISYVCESRPNNFDMSCNILSKYLNEIKNFFTKEETFQIFQDRKYQYFLMKNEVINIEDISVHYHNNQQIIAFFIKGATEDQIKTSIKNNDICKFQQIVSNTNVPLNSTIPFSITDSIKLSNNTKQPTLLEYAVAFSAIDIVKFILMNEEEAEISNADLYKDIGRYAVYGGNSEIIHLLEQKHLISNISSQRMFYLLDAISYHQNEIVDYFVDNYNTQFIFDYLSNCLQWRNFQCFNDHIIDSVFTNINQLNIYKQSLLIFACQSGIIEIVECLLSSYDNLNVNNQDIYKVFIYLLLKQHFIIV